MDKIEIFKNTEFGSLRTVVIEKEPWFVGKDVARALGYTDVAHAVLDHVDDEDRINSKTHGQNVPEFGQRGTWLVNESGVYSLVFGSKLPSAKKFKRWVTSEVLPAIRKTGAYVTTTAAAEAAEKTLKEEKYMRAAQYISTCPKSNLPLVLSALHEAGVDLVLLESAKVTDGECARLINKAVNDYGLSMTAIGRLVGLRTTQISRIRSGESTPSAQRSKVICDAIRSALPEIE